MQQKTWTYYLERTLCFLCAIILLETLFYKFTGHPNSVDLFTQLGIEPWGRIGTGILELIASALLLFRKVSFHGALLALGLMGGAVFSHLTKLGISFNDDGGQLFYRAVVVLAASLAILALRKDAIQEFIDEVRSSQKK